MRQFKVGDEVIFINGPYKDYKGIVVGFHVGTRMPCIYSKQLNLEGRGHSGDGASTEFSRERGYHGHYYSSHIKLSNPSPIGLIKVIQ
jgi:hypothetical protein